jgi:hypothetical protein
MAESDQFALHPPVSPGGILLCHTHHEILDRCGSGWTSGAPACGVVPFACDELAVPVQDRGGGDREDFGPAAPRHKPREGGQLRTVGGRVTDPGNLPP